jgi:hypothetical protein
MEVPARVGWDSSQRTSTGRTPLPDCHDIFTKPGREGLEGVTGSQEDLVVLAVLADEGAGPSPDAEDSETELELVDDVVADRSTHEFISGLDPPDGDQLGLQPFPEESATQVHGEAGVDVLDQKGLVVVEENELVDFEDGERPSNDGVDSQPPGQGIPLDIGRLDDGIAGQELLALVRLAV